MPCSAEFVEEVRRKYEPAAPDQSEDKEGGRADQIAIGGSPSSSSSPASSSPAVPHKEEEEEEEDEEAPPPAERDMGYCFGCHTPSATAVRCAGCSGVFWCSENGSTCATVRGWTHDCLCKTWRRYCAPFPSLPHTHTHTHTRRERERERES
jgi:hypothetical protein